MTRETTALASILVVDDTVENLRLLARLLGERGYEIRPVTNGRQALQAAVHDPPDLILLDINMPDINGFDVCVQLKSHPELADIPVIFLTAMVSTSDKVRAFEVGGVDYITKPFQVEEVLARVKTHVALRRARLELSQSYERLRSLEKLRDDLVHMIVHDMRSPLTVLIGSLDILRRDLARTAQSEEVQEDCRVALRSASSLNRMADALLDVSRLEEGQMPVEPQPSDLFAIVADVRSVFATLDRRREVFIEGMSPTIASFDPALVRRVIENLIGNGFKHTPPGKSLTITIATLDNDRVRVAVQDSGPGVPPEARTRIFEKFGAVAQRNDHSYHSVGLGLAFCRLAVLAHGGSIGVDSASDGGSIFWFELPARAQPNASSSAS